MRDVYVIGAYTTVFKKPLNTSGGGVIGREEAVASVVILQKV